MKKIVYFSYCSCGVRFSLYSPICFPGVELAKTSSHQQPHIYDQTDNGIEIIAVRVNPEPFRSSHVIPDSSFDSQSQTEYEVVDSNYTMSDSDEDEEQEQRDR